MKHLVSFLWGAFTISIIWGILYVHAVFIVLLLTNTIPLMVVIVAYIERHWDDK